MRLPSMEESAALDAIRNMVNDADTSATADVPLVGVDEYLNPIATSRSCTVDDSVGGLGLGGRGLQTLSQTGDGSRSRTLQPDFNSATDATDLSGTLSGTGAGGGTTTGTRSPLVVFEGLQDPRASSSRMQQVRTRCA